MSDKRFKEIPNRSNPGKIIGPMIHEPFQIKGEPSEFMAPEVVKEKGSSLQGSFLATLMSEK